MIDKVANMEPTKEFFICALVKDIEIKPAIFEFIDNSIKAAEKITKGKPLKGYFIKLCIVKNDSGKFQISIDDNCGGISLEDAENKAFVLGNDYVDNNRGNGIGMKRALFKLSDEFTIESYTRKQNFRISLNIEKWLKNKKWNASIEKINETYKYNQGTRIIATLKNDIQSELSSKKFENKLMKEIKSKYEFRLKSGFEIYFNDIKIEYDSGEIYNLLEDRTYKLYGNNVQIKIEDKSKRDIEYYGWNYVINGRIVVQGDKSYISNWKEVVKNKNYNYDKFVGFVFIDGETIEKNMLTTTKERIDTSSLMYSKIKKWINSAIENTRGNFRCYESSVEYKRPKDKIDMLANTFGLSSNAAVGRKTFDICCENMNVIKKLK